MYCKNCGKEIEQNIKFCPECGAAVASEQQGKKGKVKKKAKKPIFKRWWFWVLIIILAVSLFGGGNDDTSSGLEGSQGSVIPQATTPVPAPLEASGSLGDFEVQIHDFEIADDYAGDPSILIDFTFTNNSEENESVYVNLIYMAYQNGVQLDSTYFLNNAHYNPDDLMKDVKPGSSLDLTVAYSLNSNTAPVEFEIGEAFSFNEDKLGKTFEIAEGGTTVLSTAPIGTLTDDILDRTVSIVSYKIVKNYEGKNVILFELGFTNNGDSATNFYSAFNFTPFQDGIELETAFLMDESDNIGNSTLNVKPGAGIPVALAFVLSNNTSPVEIEITDVWGFSDKTITTEIALQ